MNKVRKLKDKEDMEIMERMYLEEHGPPIERNKKKQEEVGTAMKANDEIKIEFDLKEDPEEKYI